MFSTISRCCQDLFFFRSLLFIQRSVEGSEQPQLTFVLFSMPCLFARVIRFHISDHKLPLQWNYIHEGETTLFFSFTPTLSFFILALI